MLLVSLHEMQQEDGISVCPGLQCVSRERHNFVAPPAKSRHEKQQTKPSFASTTKAWQIRRMAL
jgi:hypothetical protein